MNTFRVHYPSFQIFRVSIERFHIGSIHRAPMRKQKLCVRISIGYFNCAIQANVPTIVREVEKDDIRGGQAQKLRQETGVARCPNQTIGGLNKETAIIFPLEYMVETTELILPRMPCRSETDCDILDLECICQAMSERRQSQMLHQRIDIECRMIFLADSRQLLASWYTEVIVVAMGYQNRIQSRNLFWQNRRLYQERHIKAYQQRIYHDTGSPAINEEARISQPTDNCMIIGSESFLTKVLRGRRISLPLFRIFYLGHTVTRYNCH